MFSGLRDIDFGRHWADGDVAGLIEALAAEAPPPMLVALSERRRTSPLTTGLFELERRLLRDGLALPAAGEVLPFLLELAVLPHDGERPWRTLRLVARLVSAPSFEDGVSCRERLLESYQPVLRLAVDAAAAPLTRATALVLLSGLVELRGVLSPELLALAKEDGVVGASALLALALLVSGTRGMTLEQELAAQALAAVGLELPAEAPPDTRDVEAAAVVADLAAEALARPPAEAVYAAIALLVASSRPEPGAVAALALNADAWGPPGCPFARAHGLVSAQHFGASLLRGDARFDAHLTAALEAFEGAQTPERIAQALAFLDAVTGFSRRLDDEPLDGAQRRFVDALVHTRHDLRAPELEDLVREELLASREALAQLLRG